MKLASSQRLWLFFVTLLWATCATNLAATATSSFRIHNQESGEVLIAQDDNELMQDICAKVVTELVYPSPQPTRLDISNPNPDSVFVYFRSLENTQLANIQTVTGYNAYFDGESGNPYSDISLPPGYTLTDLSFSGACGFNSLRHLTAVRISSGNILVSPRDFQDYGEVSDLGRMIVFRRPASTENPQNTDKALTVLIDDRREEWSVNCRTGEVSGFGAEQPMTQSDLRSVIEYACEE